MCDGDGPGEGMWERRLEPKKSSRHKPAGVSGSLLRKWWYGGQVYPLTGAKLGCSTVGQNNEAGSHHDAATTACFLILGLLGGVWRPRCL
jgi:hypothetical protein